MPMPALLEEEVDEVDEEDEDEEEKELVLKSLFGLPSVVVAEKTTLVGEGGRDVGVDGLVMDGLDMDEQKRSVADLALLAVAV